MWLKVRQLTMPTVEKEKEKKLQPALQAHASLDGLLAQRSSLVGDQIGPVPPENARSAGALVAGMAR